MPCQGKNLLVMLSSLIICSETLYHIKQDIRTLLYSNYSKTLLNAEFVEVKKKSTDVHWIFYPWKTSSLIGQNSPNHMLSMNKCVCLIHLCLFTEHTLVNHKSEVNDFDRALMCIDCLCVSTLHMSSAHTCVKQSLAAWGKIYKTHRTDRQSKTSVRWTNMIQHSCHTDCRETDVYSSISTSWMCASILQKFSHLLH